MKVNTRLGTFDPHNELVIIIFKDDEDRERVIRHLQAMEPRTGPRIYASYPDNMDRVQAEAAIDAAWEGEKYLQLMSNTSSMNEQKNETEAL